MKRQELHDGLEYILERTGMDRDLDPSARKALERLFNELSRVAEKRGSRETVEEARKGLGVPPPGNLWSGSILRLADRYLQEGIVELARMDVSFKHGKLPAPQELKEAVEQELSLARPHRYEKHSPDFVRLVVAASLLGDPKLYREVVELDTLWDLYFYEKQKDSGMGAEDLGPKPEFGVSDQRLAKSVRAYAAGFEPSIGETIEKKLAAVRAQSR
jgi:hypothetical protein